MIGTYGNNFQEPWVSKNGQKQPKIAQIGQNWPKLSEMRFWRELLPTK